MSLLEWKYQKDQRAREKGKRYTYADVVDDLGKWKIRWIKAVFLGTGKPGRDLLLALKELTGLEIGEVLGGKDENIRSIR